MKNTEAARLQVTLKMQAESVTGSYSLQSLVEKLNSSQPSDHLETIRQLNGDGGRPANLERLIKAATIHVPAPLAEYIARHAQPGTGPTPETLTQAVSP